MKVYLIDTDNEKYKDLINDEFDLYVLDECLRLRNRNDSKKSLITSRVVSKKHNKKGYQQYEEFSLKTINSTYTFRTYEPQKIDEVLKF